jgi:hypothetical protein
LVKKTKNQKAIKLSEADLGMQLVRKMYHNKEEVKKDIIENFGGDIRKFAKHILDIVRKEEADKSSESENTMANKPKKDYVVREIEGEYKAITYDPDTMELRRLGPNQDYLEPTYTKTEAEILAKQNEDVNLAMRPRLEAINKFLKENGIDVPEQLMKRPRIELMDFRKCKKVKPLEEEAEEED